MSIIDTGKELAKLVQQLDNIEIQQKVIQLQSEMLGIQEDVQALRRENEELKDNIALDAELVFRGAQHYYLDSAPESRRGPFCTLCWDDRKKLIRVHRYPSSHDYYCPHCEKDH